MGDSTTTERPDFGPQQVRNPEEIQVGKKYRTRHRNCGPMDIIIVSPPQIADDHLVTFYRRPPYPDESCPACRKEEEGHGHRLFLSDCGVISYSDGWHKENWLEKME